MATSPLVLNDNASQATTYVIRSQNGNSMQYVAQDSSLSEPKIIDLKLEPKGPGLTGNDRNHISIKRSILDENNIARTASITSQLSIPKCKEWTTEMTKELISEMRGYLGGQAEAGTTASTVTTDFPDDLSKLIFA